MPTEGPDRHPFDELRHITSLPLEEVVVLGGGERLRRLSALLNDSPAVRRISESLPWSEGTRLVVIGEKVPQWAAAVERAPPPRTCVFVDLAANCTGAPLPIAGMCLAARLLEDADGRLRARLLPVASTTPEALDLVAELLFQVGVAVEQAAGEP